jgi:hypothetical protein
MLLEREFVKQYFAKRYAISYKRHFIVDTYILERPKNDKKKLGTIIFALEERSTEV